MSLDTRKYTLYNRGGNVGGCQKEALVEERGGGGEGVGREEEKEEEE